MSITKEQILSDPDEDQWLKDAILALDTQDPHRALNNAKVLYALERIRVDSLT